MRYEKTTLSSPTSEDPGEPLSYLGHVYFTEEEYQQMRADPACNVKLFDTSVKDIVLGVRRTRDEKWACGLQLFRACGLAHWLPNTKS